MNINDCNVYAITDEHFNCAEFVFASTKVTQSHFLGEIWRSIRPVLKVEEAACTFFTCCCQTRWHWSRVNSGGKAGQSPCRFQLLIKFASPVWSLLYGTRLICVNVLLSQLLFTEVRCFCLLRFIHVSLHLSHWEKHFTPARAAASAGNIAWGSGELIRC